MREGSLLPTRLWTSLYFPFNVPAIWPAPRDHLPHHHPLPWQLCGWSTSLFSTIQLTQLTTICIHSYLPVQLPPLWFMPFVSNGASNTFPFLLRFVFPTSYSSALFSWRSVVRHFNFALTLNPAPQGPFHLPLGLLCWPQSQITPKAGFSVLGLGLQSVTEENHRHLQIWPFRVYILVPIHKSLFLSAAELRYVPQRSSGMFFLYWTPNLN